jgi:hypothetical protein
MSNLHREDRILAEASSVLSLHPSGKDLLYGILSSQALCHLILPKKDSPSTSDLIGYDDECFFAPCLCGRSFVSLLAGRNHFQILSRPWVFDPA